MAKYLCPVITCNVCFEGSLWDIMPSAIGHAQGSHQTVMTEEEFKESFRQQENPSYQKIPVNQPVEKPVDPVVKKAKEQAIDEWWKSLDQK